MLVSISMLLIRVIWWLNMICTLSYCCCFVGFAFGWLLLLESVTSAKYLLLYNRFDVEIDTSKSLDACLNEISQCCFEKFYCYNPSIYSILPGVVTVKLFKKEKKKTQCLKI